MSDDPKRRELGRKDPATEARRHQAPATAPERYVCDACPSVVLTCVGEAYEHDHGYAIRQAP